LLVAALLATYVLSAIVAARFALDAREVRVPALVGTTVNGASEALADVGRAVKVEESRRVDPKIPAGQIARQEPPAGEPARRGRSVRVWLSAGARVGAVPRLIGEGARTAQLRLEQDGLALAGLSEIRSNDYPPDTVIGQTPPPEEQGDAVALLVNRGDRAAACVMPDLIGVAETGAAELLRSAGFRVAVVAQSPYPGVPAGIVLRQSPQPGFRVTPGDAISLEVSR
ncbi:MAG TPA: PASTA domain-containing protein, partial [Vicinamibacterales bacterium]|nr:PASTA domain-containing protein [Vicinamibacterales bacterium]